MTARPTENGSRLGKDQVDYVRDTGGGKDFGKVTAAEYTPQIREGIKRLYHDKIGLFVHFGPYSQLGGVWDGKPADAEWIMQGSQIPVETYEQEASAKFKPSRFDADEWVRLARSGGMGFMVVTAKHHDGFALFQSAHSYNLWDFVGFKRDLVSELATACKKADIGLGLYYSQSQDWHEAGAVGNTWDFPEDLPPESFDDYFDGKVVPQVTELTTQYGALCMFWFDTPLKLQDSHCETLLHLIKSKQPGALVNSRLGNGYGHFDVSLDHGSSPSVIKTSWLSDLKVPWQTHDTVAGSWGYMRRAAHRDRTAEHASFIHTFCQIVSRGGVYLLNVAPGPDGTISKEQIDTVTAMGDWLGVNGEAIYDADPSPFKWPPYAITSKPGKLYIHLDSSEVGKAVEIQRLLSKVQDAYCLTESGKTAIEFEQTGETFSCKLSESLVQPHVTVVALDIADEAALVADETLEPEPDGTIRLPVARCEYGDTIRIGYDYKTGTTRRWGENRKQLLVWTVRIDKPKGQYALRCEQTADDRLTYEVTVTGQTITVSGSGETEMSQKRVPGRVTLDQPGIHMITARPSEVTRYGSRFRLKSLELVPVQGTTD